MRNHAAHMATTKGEAQQRWTIRWGNPLVNTPCLHHPQASKECRRVEEWGTCESTESTEDAQ